MKTLHAAVTAMIPLTASTATLAGPEEILDRYGDAQTLLVGRASLDAVDLDDLTTWLIDAGLDAADTPEARDAAIEELRNDAAPAERLMDGLKRAGVREAWILWSLSDYPMPLPFVVMPAGDAATALAVLPAPTEPAGDPTEHLKVILGSDVLLATGATLARLREEQNGTAATPEPLARAASLALTGEHDVELVLMPTADVVRVLEAMLPELPREIGGGPVSLLTRGLSRAAMRMQLPPEEFVDLAIESESPEDARALHGWIERLAARAADPRTPPNGGILASLLDLADPRLDGDEISIRMDEDRIATMMREVIAPAVLGARDQAKQVKAMSQVRQILMAAHVYAQEHEDNFPGALDVLIDTGHIAPDALRLPTGRDLVYLPPRDVKQVNWATTPMILEIGGEFPEKGLIVGFLDGHVELVADEARYEALRAGH